MKIKCKSILIIEDDEAIRTSLDDVLSSEGYKVFEVANGKLALSMLEKLPRPSLLLLDLMMPVMNGYDFTDAIKLTDYKDHFPIVVMSASRDGEQYAKQFGYSFLKKPLDVDLLLNLIEENCNKATAAP